MKPSIVAPFGRTNAAVKARVAIATGVKLRDWDLVESALMKYGYYLELIDPLADIPTGVVQSFEPTHGVIH